jgi:cytoskeletal protein CcmA (bactofilin family)
MGKHRAGHTIPMNCRYGLAIALAAAAGLAMVAEVRADDEEHRQFMGSDLAAAGDLVIVSGDDLDGVFAAGETVELVSPTREDALLAGRRVKVRAAVGDDAYLAGETVDVSAPVAGRVVAAGETVTLDARTTTGGAVRLFGRRVEVAGTVGGDSWIAAESVRLSGRFAGDVTVTAETVDIAPDARFDGMLVYRSPEEPAVPDTAAPPERRRYEKWDPEAWEWGPPGYWRTLFGVAFGAVLLFPLSLLVAGAILLATLGGVMDRIAETGRARPGASIGAGLVTLAVWAVAALLLMLTLIGAPLGILLFLALPLIVMLGYVTGALTLALGAWRSLGKAKPGGLGRFGLLALALFVLSIVGLIPVAGFIVGLLVTLAGLGAAMLALRGRGGTVAGAGG